MIDIDRGDQENFEKKKLWPKSTKNPLRIRQTRMNPDDYACTLTYNQQIHGINWYLLARTILHPLFRLAQPQNGAILTLKWSWVLTAIIL